MNKGSIIVAGIGPGSPQDITPAVCEAIAQSDVVIGYKYYFQFIEPWLSSTARCIDTGMKKERERAGIAFEEAEKGQHVTVISSGDAGIYGMAPLIYEMKKDRDSAIEIRVLPGISAFQKAASLLGAPIGHDLCIISLSDLMTPWEKIEKRIIAAAEADFVTAVYNPKSEGRYWQLHRLKALFLERRASTTPVGYVREAGRPGERVVRTTLAQFDPEEIDMFTVVLIGNSQSYQTQDAIITPRGYYRERIEGAEGKGQQIMMESFRTIEREMRHPEVPIDRRWALFHAIHTTADFSMEDILYTDPNAVARMHEAIKKGEIKTIVTDVSMVAAGIRKGAVERLGLSVKCYITDPRVVEFSKMRGTTRAEEAIRLAVEEDPNALFAFGNAPTALIELCRQIRLGKATPSGIIAAPVGFVHVCESKHRVHTFPHIPKIIVEGRRGGSNLAATLINAILCYDDAAALYPGRDV